MDKKTSLEGGTIVKERRKRKITMVKKRFKTLADTFKNRNKKKKKNDIERISTDDLVSLGCLHLHLI